MDCPVVIPGTTCLKLGAASTTAAFADPALCFAVFWHQKEDTSSLLA